jgi:hypothetical protein
MLLSPHRSWFRVMLSLGNLARWEGRESWTAPVYILTADFAAVLPANED